MNQDRRYVMREGRNNVGLFSDNLKFVQQNSLLFLDKLETYDKSVLKTWGREMSNGHGPIGRMASRDQERMKTAAI